jgi:PadR family transcriptional regulator AphA
MSLEYAILGFLNYHPYTGYDLKKVFDKSVRHFWPDGTGPRRDGKNLPG